MEIKDIYEQYEKLLDKDIEVKGWIRKHRKQKEVGFMDVSDGTCFKKLQVVYDKSVKDFEDILKIQFQNRTLLNEYQNKNNLKAYYLFGTYSFLRSMHKANFQENHHNNCHSMQYLVIAKTPTLHKKYTQNHMGPDFVKPLFLLQITYPEIFHKKFTAP